MTEWQPIETAPKDGSIIDLWSEFDGRWPDCFWGKRGHSCGEDGVNCDSDWHGEPEGWVWASMNIEVPEIQMTHWMPIPAPPSQNKEASNAGR